MPQILAVLYAALVLIGGLCWVPNGIRNTHHAAARDLGANTRLADIVLLLPDAMTLPQRLYLAEERRELIGRYVKTPVHKGQPVIVGNTSRWPQLAEDAVPVELDVDPPPDAMLMNQGALVDVFVENKPVYKDVTVLAVVSVVRDKVTTWYALLPRAKVTPDSLGKPKDAKLIVRKLPGQ